MSGIVGSYFNTRGSGVVAKLGTDGQVFTSTGAGLSQGFEAVAAGGAYTFIGGVTASGTSPLSITSGIDSTYDVYMIVGSGLSLSTDGTALNFRMSVATSFITSSDYRYGKNYASSSASYAHGDHDSNSAGGIVLNYNGSSDAVAEPKSFVLYLFNPASTTMWKNVSWHEWGMQHDGNAYQSIGGGVLENTGAVDGVQIYPTGGDFTLGTLRVYGLANS